MTISQSGVWRILKRLDLNRLPASQRYRRHQQRWKRYEKQRPGHHVQTLGGVLIDDAGVFNGKLREWEDYYNYARPHGGLGGQTPYERLLQKSKAQPVTDQLQHHN